LRYKSYQGITKAELRPPPVPKPWSIIAFDFAMLTRKTHQDHTALLVMCDMFSGYPFIEPVKDTGSLSTARALVKRIISVFGANIQGFYCDKGSGFVSQVNKHLASMLSLRMRSISSLNPRSAGLAESLVKRTKMLLSMYAKSDREIDDAVPLIELALRATVDPSRGCSPHYAAFGSDIPLFEINHPEFQSASKPEAATYLNWLSHTLKDIQAGVTANLKESKEYNKKVYDKRHHTAPPAYNVGDLVLLHDTRVKPGSDHVITRAKYHGPYIVTARVEKTDPNDAIGVAFRLTSAETGKTLKNLVGSDRLRPYSSTNIIHS
jgi:hypothetical protein